MILSKCAICNSKKSKFINKQEAKGLLSNLGIKTPLNKIPTLGDILFWMNIIMNEMINNFLLTGYKFMPEMHSKDFLIVLVDRLLKIKKEFKNVKKLAIQAIFTKMN